MEHLHPLDPFVEELEFMTAPLKPNGSVNNAFVGATAGDPILDRGLKELRPREYHGYDKHGTGPRFLDALLQDYPEVTRLPTEFFYQTSPRRRANALVVHHAAQSWKGIDSYRSALKLAERRQLGHVIGSNVCSHPVKSDHADERSS